MQDLIRSGQWQVMTPDEQVRIKRQMAEGHLSTEDVGKMAARAGVMTVLLSHLTWKADDDYSMWAEEVKKLREWAYARAYQNSDQRTAELFHWLHRYNWHRPHASLKAKTPISRLGLSEDNLLRLHS
jgi:transposase InsO family protein